MPEMDQIAHDLALAYINNRYGAEVLGEFSVETSPDRDVSGSGEVWTRRLPDVDEIRKTKVGTGQKRALGLLEKKTWVEAGYEVDSVFKRMIDDYYHAHARFLELLEKR